MKSKPSYDKGVLVQSIESWGNVGQCLIGWNNLFTAFSCASPSQVSCHPAKKNHSLDPLGPLGPLGPCGCAKIIGLKLIQTMLVGGWDYEIPNMMGKIKFMFQTTKQHVSFIFRPTSIVPLVFLPIMNCIVPWYHTVDGRNRAPVGDCWKP